MLDTLPMRTPLPRAVFRLATAAAATLTLLSHPASAATYDWSTGVFIPGSTAPSPLGAADTLNVIAGGGKQFLGVSFVNDGTVQFQPGAGVVYLSSGASVTNNGLWQDLGTGNIGLGNAAAGTFINNGTFSKVGGGMSYLVALPLVNNGVIDVQQGKLVVSNLFSNDGTLTGDGEIQSFGGFTNHGTVAPGSVGVGTLALNGGYTQSASGNLAVDLGNSASFDTLTVSAGAILDGTLALNCVACSFAVGETITILDAATTLSGSFSSLSMTGFASGAFDVIYDAPSASVSLLVTQAVTAVPEPASVALMLLGLAGVGAAARKRNG